METLIVILLIVIAYILWRIYRQKEEEKEIIANEKLRLEDEKLEVECEQAKKEKLKDYPHLYGKLEGNWLEVFADYTEKNIPLLQLSFRLYLEESVKIDFSEGAKKWDDLWNLTEELLEHLEKYHEGSIAEHEIAVCTYWQIVGTAVGELIKENPEIEGNKLEVEPYTNITKIMSLFPKKSNHPKEELTFIDEKGLFPRESKGSTYIHDKIK